MKLYSDGICGSGGAVVAQLVSSLWSQLSRGDKRAIKIGKWHTARKELRSNGKDLSIPLDLPIEHDQALDLFRASIIGEISSHQVNLEFKVRNIFQRSQPT
jgi:hypothetical protein